MVKMTKQIDISVTFLENISRNSKSSEICKFGKIFKNNSTKKNRRNKSLPSQNVTNEAFKLIGHYFGTYDVCKLDRKGVL